MLVLARRDLLKRISLLGPARWAQGSCRERHASLLLGGGDPQGGVGPHLLGRSGLAPAGGPSLMGGGLSTWVGRPMPHSVIPEFLTETRESPFSGRSRKGSLFCRRGDHSDRVIEGGLTPPLDPPWGHKQACDPGTPGPIGHPPGVFNRAGILFKKGQKRVFWVFQG